MIADNDAQAGALGSAPVTEAEKRVNRRRVREGTVVENRMDKTAVVAVVERVRHSKYAKTVQRDVATAEGYGVTGTPSFLLGKSTRDGVSGVILVGAVPLGEFDAKVKEIAP